MDLVSIATVAQQKPTAQRNLSSGRNSNSIVDINNELRIPDKESYSAMRCCVAADLSSLLR
jgi:hypothetical protein